MSKMLVLYRGKTSTIDSIREDFPAMAGAVGVEVNFCDISNLTSGHLKDADSVMLVRVMDPAVVGLVKKIRKGGIFVIAFYDDDLLNLPDSLPSIGYQVRSMRKILKLSDAILTSNPKIQESYKALSGSRSYLIHAAVSKKTISSIPYWKRSEDTISIVYAAGSAHAGNIEKYIVPILEKLGNRYESKVRMEFVGVKPRIDKSYGIKIVFTDGMPIDEYREYMRRSEFDLGLAVLESDSFSECKYFNKFIEYTIAGAVGLYSNCKPYTYAIQDGSNGFLAENDPDQWYERLCYIIDNKGKLDFCKNNAIEQLKEKHNINTISFQLIQDMPEIVQSRRNKSDIPLNTFKVKDAFFVIATRIYHYGWHIKREGFGWIKDGIRKRLYD